MTYVPVHHGHRNGRIEHMSPQVLRIDSSFGPHVRRRRATWRELLAWAVFTIGLPIAALLSLGLFVFSLIFLARVLAELVRVLGGLQ